MVDAIILAGGENGGHFGRHFPEKYPAMLEIGGRPMVSYVADALAASANVGKIYVAGPAGRLAGCPLPSSAVIIESGGDIIETTGMAVRALGHAEKTLVATADIPLLTKEAVDDFLRLCETRQAEFYYPIISKKTYENKFPGSKRTYVRLKEGVFTGGNLFLFKPEIVDRCAQVAANVAANRKNPLKLCQMLGGSFVLKFALGQLGMRETEARASEMLNISGAVLESAFPELGLDVDKPADWEFAAGEIAKLGGN